MRFAASAALGSALALALAACNAQPADDAAPAGTDATATFPEQPTPSPQGRYAPRNECIELAGAKGFLLMLENAVKARDADKLIALTDPNVKLDFGGGAGRDVLRERLASADGKLWDALDRVTKLGCASDGNGNMVMPWFFAQDMNDVDTANAMLVTGADVPVRQSASDIAPVVAKVSWDMVDLVDGFDRAASFLKVRTADGTQGYVAGDKLRSALDYRLIATQKDGKWRITAFVAGD